MPGHWRHWHRRRQLFLCAVALPAIAGVLVMFGACSHQLLPKSAAWLQFENDTMAELRQGKFEVVLRVADVRSSISESARQIRTLSDPFDGLADADALYYSTDATVVGAPSRRMMAAAVTRDAGVMFVETGGFARRTDVVLVRLSSAAHCRYAAGINLTAPASGADRRQAERIKRNIQNLSQQPLFHKTSSEPFQQCRNDEGTR